MENNSMRVSAARGPKACLIVSISMNVLELIQLHDSKTISLTAMNPL